MAERRHRNRSCRSRLDDNLTIDQGRPAEEFGAGLDHPAIGPSPVPAMTGKRPDVASVDDNQGAITVVLDLVNPTFSGGWFWHESGDFRLDEAERCRR